MTVSERSFFSPLSLSLERWELDVGGEESRTWESTFKFRIAAPFFLSTFHFRCCRCLLRFVVVVFFRFCVALHSGWAGKQITPTTGVCVCCVEEQKKTTPTNHSRTKPHLLLFLGSCSLFFGHFLVSHGRRRFPTPRSLFFLSSRSTRSNKTSENWMQLLTCSSSEK